MGFFYFFRAQKVTAWNVRKFCFLIYKKIPFPQIKGIFSSFRFLKYKNSFLLRKHKKFLNIRARKFHFLKYKEFFFWFPFLEIYDIFLVLEPESSIFRNITKVIQRKKFNEILESVPGSCFWKTFPRRCLTVFRICLGFWIYQDSEYASSSKYAKVLNILFQKYKKV